MSACPDTHVRYIQPVYARIDPELWAAELPRLIEEFSGGNKSAFARRVGKTVRTLDRWIAKQGGVSIDSVLSVFDSLDMSDDRKLDLLNRVSVTTRTNDEDVEPLPAPPIPPDPREDPVIKAIMADPQWTEAERLELVEEQLAVMKADLDRRMADYERLIRRLERRREAS